MDTATPNGEATETNPATKATQKPKPEEAATDAATEAATSSQPAAINICNFSQLPHCKNAKCSCKNCKCTCCEPPKKPTPPKQKPGKAEPVLRISERLRMIDLGLGRGIDASEPRPWENKNAFQVRRVTAEAVIGTEQGGALQSFEREVSSVVNMQMKLNTAVIDLPNAPVDIFMEAEASRSVSSTRKSLGKRVINRTVSFIGDFEDIPYVNPGAAIAHCCEECKFKKDIDPEPAQPQAVEKEKSDSVADLHHEMLTFEQRLTRWILTRMKETSKTEFKPGQCYHINPIPVFRGLSDLKAKKDQIVKFCYEFIRHFKITHYVSSIDLGAMEYRVMSESDFNSSIGAGGSLAVHKLVDVGASSLRTSKVFRKATNVKSIGTISDDNEVVRASHHEAVVGIKVQPISTLVRHPLLQLALKIALVAYIEKQSTICSGPFYVAFGPEQKLQYWKIKNETQLFGTPHLKEASHFYVVSSASGDHPYEFHIAYRGEDETPHQPSLVKQSLPPMKTKTTTKPIPRYLDAGVDPIGGNPGPLQLKYHVSKRSRLLLIRRVADEDGPVDPTTWTEGKDMFFLNCARRKFKWDGYVAMTRNGSQIEEEWKSNCYPRRQGHNDENRRMLFRLIPVEKKTENQEVHDILHKLDDEKSLEDQLKDFGE